MTNAIISGRLGVAVAGGTAPQYVIRRDNLHEQVAIAPAEGRTLLREAPDPEYQTGLDDSEIRDQLELASDASMALDLVLFLLDRNLSDETRECAASELAELIVSDRVVNRLQQLLYAKPLPSEADIDHAIQVAASRAGVSSFLCDLRDEQPSIVVVRDAWDLMPFDEGKRRAFESAFLAYGVFAAFAKALANDINIDEVVLQFGINPALKSELPNVTHVLNAWKQQMPVQRQRPLIATATNASVNQTVINGEPVSRQTRQRADVARDAALTQVTKIAELVNQGKDAQAKQILDELLQNQMRHKNGQTHAVKSLCNIVTQIRGSGREAFALDCLFRALNLSADPIAFTQLGTLLRDFQKYDESRQAYDKAIALVEPSDVYHLQKIHAAKAHILTEQEHYDEAIAAYEAIPFHSSSPSIETALADVYRRKGCFSVATERYLHLIQNYPDLDRAYAGRAEIAKRRGDPHRSIRIYNFILRDNGPFHLEDRSRIVYQLAKGNLLKMVGQLDKAFELVSQVADEGPYNLSAQLQLASLLAIKGQSDESLTHIPQGSQSNRDWHAHYFRGLTYFRMGKIAEAKAELLDRIQLAHVLLEDRPLVNTAAAFVQLATGDVTSAKQVLEGVQSVDRRVRDLKEVLLAHIRSTSKVEQPKFPRLRRANAHLREAVQSIRDGNVSEALTHEALFLLKVA